MTWIEKVEAEFTCTGFADEAERAQLAAPFIGDPRDVRGMRRYFRGEPQDERHARFRHLLMLAAVGWWADIVDDQRLRGETYGAIGHLADGYAARGEGDPLFRQIARCARVQILSTFLEHERPDAAERVAGTLTDLYGEAPPSLAVEDWPLILALREARLEPRARNAIALLSARAIRFASASIESNAPGRASRLLSAAAQGALALGELDDAKRMALGSMTITGKPPAADAAWRALPTLYDAFLATKGPQEAAVLSRLVPDATMEPPVRNDRGAAFEALLRLARAAATREQYEEMARIRIQATKHLLDERRVEGLSLTFLRRALNDLAAERAPDLATVARCDPNFGADTVANYVRSYDTFVRQAQGQFLANARVQIHFQYKIDNALHALTELYTAVPGARARIEDVTFRLAQLRSFGRLTLATLSAEIDRTRLDPKSRADVERFFKMSTMATPFLRNVLRELLPRGDATLPDSAAVSRAVTALEMFSEESSSRYDEYLAFLHQKVPRIAELVTPRPLPVAEFQRLLEPDEAIVATLVTPLDLYVWAVTPGGVVVARSRVTDWDVSEKVQRLRAGLVPASDGGRTRLPPFDAAAAHELYRLVFEPVAAALKGARHVVWYGHGPLGTIPPAVLVTAPPPRPRLKSPRDFAGTGFLVDRFAVSALADLSLFPLHRKAASRPDWRRAFLGVGAPMLAIEDLATKRRAKSYDLAGGLDGKALGELPKLAESVDELKALAGIFGESVSTLWIGPEANERHFVDDALGGYRVITLATHGFLPNEIRNVPEPALLLALDLGSGDRFEGLLTTREIASLRLDADLVVLSACNTASADGRPRAEAFTGLTQAFFAAGARTLMVSHWPVMSGAAVQLSTGTVERSWRQGLPLAESLRLAMLAARKDGAASQLEAHPSFWGPFVVVGDGHRTLAR